MSILTRAHQNIFFVMLCKKKQLKIKVLEKAVAEIKAFNLGGGGGYRTPGWGVGEGGTFIVWVKQKYYNLQNKNITVLYISRSEFFWVEGEAP